MPLQPHAMQCSVAVSRGTTMRQRAILGIRWWSGPDSRLCARSFESLTAHLYANTSRRTAQHRLDRVSSTIAEPALSFVRLLHVTVLAKTDSEPEKTSATRTFFSGPRARPPPYPQYIRPTRGSNSYFCVVPSAVPTDRRREAPEVLGVWLHAVGTQSAG